MQVNRIRLVREALNLSQREFGEKLGVSRDVISNLEYGRVQPKKLLLQHLCQQYKVNPGWLETGEGAMFQDGLSPNERLGEALSLFGTLKPEFQDYALDQIKKLAELQDKY